MDSEHRAFDIRGCNLPNGQHFRIVWSLDHGPISIGLGALFDYFWDTYFGTGYTIKQFKTDPVSETEIQS